MPSGHRAPGGGMDPQGVGLEVWARPGSAAEGIGWDPWRRRWVVRVTAAAQAGEANRQVLDLVERLLGSGPGSVTLQHGATSPAKLLRVRGLSPEEVDRRLRAAVSPSFRAP